MKLQIGELLVKKVLAERNLNSCRTEPIVGVAAIKAFSFDAKGSSNDRGDSMAFSSNNSV